VQLLEQLNAQRNFETFCDVVVHVGDKGSFSAHRCILAASSAKLYTLMFSTSNDCTRNVHLDGISVSGFKIVLEFIYTGILSFDTNTVTDVITAATYLEMPAVVRLCEEFANSRKTVDDDGIKVEGSNSLQFSSTAVARTAPTGSHSRSPAGWLEHSLIAGATSAWPSRLMPSTDTVEDYSSMFEASFDQYYSSCKERGIIPVCICCMHSTSASMIEFQYVYWLFVFDVSPQATWTTRVVLISVSLAHSLYCETSPYPPLGLI